MDKKIRLGIIGIGNMGSGHACRVADGECPDFVLTAVADINPAREDWAKKRLGENVAFFPTAQEMLEIVRNVSAAMGCHADVEIIPGYAALVNDAEEANRVKRVASRLFGEENVIDKPAPSMGGEDFSFFSDCAPGAFFHVGCVSPEWMPAPPLHSKDFRIDEKCLTIGTMIHVALVLDGNAE